jgi:pimeloyl-ACP methyl ester carboxylesterase
VNIESIYKSSAGELAIKDHYDDLLSQWPIPHERLNVATPYGNTFVVASGPGDAPPVILLHGSGSNSAMWIGDIESYANDYRVYAVDIIGEPNHSDQRRPDLDSEAYGLWLKAVCDQLGIGKVILVGISLGGFMAMKFAGSYPDTVDKLVLLCPGGVGAERKKWLLLAVCALILGRVGVRAMTRYVYGSGTTGGATELTADVYDFSQLIFENFRPRMGALPRFTDAELRNLSMPVYLAAGGKDVLLRSDETVARMKECVPDLEVNFLPQAGHILVGLTDDILSFLSDA